MTKKRRKEKRRVHLSSMTSLQDEAMMHPADEAMTACRDDTRLRAQRINVQLSCLKESRKSF